MSNVMDAVWLGPNTKLPQLGCEAKTGKKIRGSGQIIRELIKQGLAREAKPSKKKEE